MSIMDLPLLELPRDGADPVTVQKCPRPRDDRVAFDAAMAITSVD